MPSTGPWRSVALAVLPVVAALILGQVATFPNLAPWYLGLAKPGFNPPNWLFGPAWTLLYTLMALAALRILRLPPDTPGRGAALAAFFMQLVLNAAWSWLFFGLHSPFAGLLDIVPQMASDRCNDRSFRTPGPRGGRLPRAACRLGRLRRRARLLDLAVERLI
jgi:tryptophan-rich sensory protein